MIEALSASEFMPLGDRCIRILLLERVKDPRRQLGSSPLMSKNNGLTAKLMRPIRPPSKRTWGS